MSGGDRCYEELGQRHCELHGAAGCYFIQGGQGRPPEEVTFEQRPEQDDKVNTVRPGDLGFLDQQADACHESHRDRKEMGRKSGYRGTQMIQGLGFLVSLLGSIESAQKLLEGFFFFAVYHL